MAAIGLDWYQLKDQRVLVVDDQALVRSLIGGILTSVGFETVAFAEDGDEALERIGSFRPDLVLLDLMMPRLDGIGVLEQLRAEAAWMDVPVLVLTAADDLQMRGRVFMAGATDFISKPVNRLELLARVKVHLSNWVLIRTLDRQLKRIDADLREAQRMQTALLPGAEALRAIERSHGVSVASHFESSSRVGGDYWTARALEDGVLAALICDFSGHGVSAALNTVRLHTLLAEVPGPVWQRPAELLGTLNAALAGQLPEGQFATMFASVVDTRADTLSYAAAAAPDAFLGRAASADVRRLDGTGLPVGLSRKARYRETTVPFPPGHYLFLYSDAFYEGVPAPKGRSGRLEFAEVFRAILAAPCADPVLPRLLDWFYARSPRPPKDDLTAVWLERRPARWEE